ncbi:MAG TPA: hypothetical protein VHL34_13045 [Rhizomicrobium sp.]|jgi:hypothetical protein|nr:hypothetical protein [Rhizomicrobium sp.]
MGICILFSAVFAWVAYEAVIAGDFLFGTINIPRLMHPITRDDNPKTFAVGVGFLTAMSLGFALAAAYQFFAS